MGERVTLYTLITCRYTLTISADLIVSTPCLRTIIHSLAIGVNGTIRRNGSDNGSLILNQKAVLWV